MTAFAIKIERAAMVELTYSVKASTRSEARWRVKSAIDHNTLSLLGDPISEEYHDVEDAGWALCIEED